MYKNCLELLSCNTRDDLQSKVQSLVEMSGFEYFMLGVFPTTKPTDISIISTFPDRWLSRYQAEGYNQIDPLVLHVLERNQPIAWTEKIFDESATRFLYEEAQVYGVSSGACVPLAKNREVIAGFSLSRYGNTHSAHQDIVKQLANATLIGKFCFENYQALTSNKKPETEVELTKRERDCLYLACLGMSEVDIADKLKINTRTASMHLQNVCIKLNKNSRIALIATAIKSGMITP